MAGRSGAHWIVRAPPDKSTWGPCSLSGSCYRGKKYGDQSERQDGEAEQQLGSTGTLGGHFATVFRHFPP